MVKQATPAIGDNSGIAAEALDAFVIRIETLNEAAADIQDDLKELYIEVKNSGFDTKVVRAVIKRKAEDKAKRAEFEAMLELYEQALGVFG